MTWALVWVLTLERKFPEALQVLQKFRGETLATNTTAPCPKTFLEGSIYMLQGDEAKARTALEHALVVSEQLLREAPDDPNRHAQHGVVLAALGQKEEAINEGKRPSNCYRNRRTPLTDRKSRLRSPRFMLGRANLMKHSACSIICSRSLTVSPSRCSSSIQRGTRSGKIRATRL